MNRLTSTLIAILVATILFTLPITSVYASGNFRDVLSVKIGDNGPFQVTPFGVTRPLDSEVGNCFTALSSGFLNFTTFILNSPVGSPTQGEFVAILFSADSVTCTPIGGPLTASLGTIPSQVASYTGNLTFSFERLSGAYRLIAGTTYTLSVRLVGCSVCDSNNYWNLGGDDRIFLAISSYFWNGNVYTTNPKTVTLSFDVDPITVQAALECHRSCIT